MSDKPSNVVSLTEKKQEIKKQLDDETIEFKQILNALLDGFKEEVDNDLMTGFILVPFGIDGSNSGNLHAVPADVTAGEILGALELAKHETLLTLFIKDEDGEDIDS